MAEKKERKTDGGIQSGEESEFCTGGMKGWVACWKISLSFVLPLLSCDVAEDPCRLCSSGYSPHCQIKMQLSLLIWDVRTIKDVLDDANDEERRGEETWLHDGHSRADQQGQRYPLYRD